MLQINISEKNIKNDFAEKFFKILVIKELIHKKYFENYYITFLDGNDVFDVEKFKLKLNEIYNLIYNNDSSCIRPNNAEIIEEKTIKNVIMEYGSTYIGYNKFSEDILTHIQGNTIKMDYKIGLNKENIKKIKKGITDYLTQYYKEAFFHKDLQITLEEIVKRIIEIMKYKKS